MIWRRVFSATATVVVWRRHRKVKDAWPVVTVRRALVAARDDYLAADTATALVVLAAVDAAQPETITAFGHPGALYQWSVNNVLILTTAVGASVVTVPYEISILPRKIACDRLELQVTMPAAGSIDTLIEFQVSFIEDHEKWNRLKVTSCHDE